MNVFLFIFLLIVILLIAALSFYTGFAVGTSDKRYLTESKKKTDLKPKRKDKPPDPGKEKEHAELNKILLNIEKYDGTPATATKKDGDN